jgi:hypothetical protein
VTPLPTEERRLTLARFLRNQIALADRPPVGCVQLNNEEAEVCAQALERVEPPHCNTCSCGVLSEFHNLDDLAEIERLRGQVDRLDKKCSALAFLHYGGPDVPPRHDDLCPSLRSIGPGPCTCAHDVEAGPACTACGAARMTECVCPR